MNIEKGTNSYTPKSRKHARKCRSWKEKRHRDRGLIAEAARLVVVVLQTPLTCAFSLPVKQCQRIFANVQRSLKLHFL